MSGLRTRTKEQYSDPEWEAVSAALKSQSHAAAVADSAQLSENCFRWWKLKGAGVVTLDTVLRTLQAKKVPFVLTGTHAINSWSGRVRATHDIDILVKSGRNYARAVKALRELYPTLEVRNFAGVTGFFMPGEKQSLIDVTFPHRADIQETLATAIWVEDGDKRYRIPTLETALANKYGAMLTPTRDAGKRGMDAVDFFSMVQHSIQPGREPIDLEWLKELGEKVWPGGGGAEILRLVEEAKAGTVPNFQQLLPPAR